MDQHSLAPGKEKFFWMEFEKQRQFSECCLKEGQKVFVVGSLAPHPEPDDLRQRDVKGSTLMAMDYTDPTSPTAINAWRKGLGETAARVQPDEYQEKDAACPFFLKSPLFLSDKSESEFLQVPRREAMGWFVGCAVCILALLVTVLDWCGVL